MEKNGHKKYTVFVAETDVMGVGFVRGFCEGWTAPKGYLGDTRGTSYGWEVYLWAKSEKEAEKNALERLGLKEK